MEIRKAVYSDHSVYELTMSPDELLNIELPELGLGPDVIVAGAVVQLMFPKIFEIMDSSERMEWQDNWTGEINWNEGSSVDEFVLTYWLE